eukprot:gene6584-9999_t
MRTAAAARALCAGVTGCSALPHTPTAAPTIAAGDGGGSVEGWV